MLFSQLTHKQYSAIIKYIFAFLLCSMFFVLFTSRSHAAWTYDKDRPALFATVDCDSDGFIDLDSRYPEPGAPTGSFGTCSSADADLYLNCYDSPSTGGSGCKYITYQTSISNGIQTGGEFVIGSGVVTPPGTFVGVSVSDTQGTARSAKKHLTAPAQTPSVTIEDDGSDNCTWNPPSAPQNYTCAIDWAGNKIHWVGDATFNFATCEITATSFQATEGSTGTQIGVASYSGNLNKFSYTATSLDPSILRIDSTSGSYPNYISSVTALARGTTTIHLSGRVNNNEACSKDVPVIIDEAGPWWQVTDSDVYSSGNIISSIPTSCTGSCSNKFDIDGPGGYPGVPVHASGTPTWGQNGVISSKLWLANTTYTGKTYNYDWFLYQTAVPTDKIISEAASVITGSSVNNADLNTGYLYGGALYRFKNGDLAIDEDINIGSNKVVLFVNGAVAINKKINLTKGEGFFAIIASGNINVNQTVTNGANPALEGYFLTNGVFSTGESTTSNNQLIVRGSVAGLAGVTLARDLGTPNTTAPAEHFIYAPDLAFTMPYALMDHHINWNEINP